MWQIQRKSMRTSGTTDQTWSLTPLWWKSPSLTTLTTQWWSLNTFHFMRHQARDHQFTASSLPVTPTSLSRKIHTRRCIPTIFGTPVRVNIRPTLTTLANITNETVIRSKLVLGGLSTQQDGKAARTLSVRLSAPRSFVRGTNRRVESTIFSYLNAN